MSIAYTSNTVSGSTLVDIVSYENVYVAQNVTAGSTGNVGVHGTGDYDLVSVIGNLFGTYYAIELGDNVSSTGNSVFVGADGSVIGAGGQSDGGGHTPGIGIAVFGVDTNIENRGLVFGDDTGILIDSFQSDNVSSLIINKGSISGFGRGIDHQADQMLIVRNTGSIEGGDYAYFGSFGIDHIINRGEFIGDIDLSGGNDVYNGRKTGYVDGTVYGGSGSDRLIGGSDDDWLAGSYDKDTLTGGKGDDDFYFMSSLTGNADADQITDFSVADDTIVLDDGIFSALIGKDLTPTILQRGGGGGSGAGRQPKESPYLIYDSNKGTLAYDADGRGGSAAIVFTTLDTGLKLTAHDFLLI
ncbi:MAG: putative hemolysin-adenlyate cyclase protein [Rhizobium sp.]|nr:putative hemolysin-adenlyate cyclase protein [Rhizobium sp.]